MNYHLDDSELRTLEVDLRRAPARVQVRGNQVISRGAKIVNKHMRQIVDGHMGNWFGQPGTSYPTPIGRHVTDEMIGLMHAEIGVEKRGAGKLAHILAYGSVNNAPVFDHTASLRRAAPQVEKMMADMAEESILTGEAWR